MIRRPISEFEIQLNMASKEVSMPIFAKNWVSKGPINYQINFVIIAVSKIERKFEILWVLIKLFEVLFLSMVKYSVLYNFRNPTKGHEKSHKKSITLSCLMAFEELFNFTFSAFFEIRPNFCWNVIRRNYFWRTRKEVEFLGRTAEFQWPYTGSVLLFILKINVILPFLWQPNGRQLLQANCISDSFVSF